MEREVGMYVRFKTLSNEVKIGQIQLIDNNIYELDNNEVTADKYIIKASHTLLGNDEEDGVIEVGDYVNGYKVSFKDNDYKPFVQCDYPVQEGTTNHYRFYEEAICSIVTKEQFESMKYTIKE